eukprot:scaffold72821_cov117-Phaeocystis_antarctica.AAC.1
MPSGRPKYASPFTKVPPPHLERPAREDAHLSHPYVRPTKSCKVFVVHIEVMVPLEESRPGVQVVPIALQHCRSFERASARGHWFC